MANIRFFFRNFFRNFHNKYQLRGNNRKLILKQNFNNSQWQGSFYHRAKNMLNKLEQGVVSFERVEHFRIKLKRFDLNSINISKIQ